MSSFKAEIAEFFGAFTIILFGAAAQCQAQLYPHAGSYVQCLIGWAAGVSLGNAISGGISSGHINPAVTVAMAITRKFPWTKVPRYLVAQTLGCMAATFVVFATYRDAILAYEGAADHRSVLAQKSAAGNFISMPAKGISNSSAWFDEFVGTAILVAFISCLTDTSFHASSRLSLSLFIVIAAIAVSFGAQTGFAINPARDFGPRLALTALGYNDVWTHNGGYWFWGIWLATIPGGIVGAIVADLTIYTGDDGFLKTLTRRSPTL